MNHDTPSPHAAAEVPPQMLAAHWRAWHDFKRFTVANCIAVAGVLLLLLLIFKVF